ncbi:MAG: trypsin-like peptidase domain-containing protein [Tenericutes bacterium]|nr:trypsin-like peptidase domain-containing protein [Mycoplasmatota bacterium]
MKKAYIFIGFLLSIFTIFGISSLLNSNNLEAAPITTTITFATTYETNTTDYSALVSQIYESIYEDIYEDVYQDILDELNQDFYDQIYLQVQNDLVDIIDQEEFSIYLDKFQQDIYNVVDLSENSVFGITAFNDEEGSLGTGVVYKYDSVTELYYIATNYHVVEGATDFKIQFENESNVEANLIGYDAVVDIAVLTFSSIDLPVVVNVASLGDSETINVGEFVIAVGNPQGYEFYGSVTLGVASGLAREVDSNRYIKYIQHDAAINSGNSGGPIYNLLGEVIGINVLKYATVDIEGMGFAIPINLVKEVTERIENDQIPMDTIMPRLGSTFYSVSEIISGDKITVNDMTIDGILVEDKEITLPIGIAEGIVVRTVDSSYNLDTILEGGDLIVRINDTALTDLASMQDYLYANFYAGDTVTLYYYDYHLLTNSYESSLSSVTVTLE